MFFDMDNLNSEDEDDILGEFMAAHSEQVPARHDQHIQESLQAVLQPVVLACFNA